MAATKCLQKGQWQECANHIFSLGMWEKMRNAETVKSTGRCTKSARGFVTAAVVMRIENVTILYTRFMLCVCDRGR